MREIEGHPAECFSERTGCRNFMSRNQFSGLRFCNLNMKKKKRKKKRKEGKVGRKEGGRERAGERQGERKDESRWHACAGDKRYSWNLALCVFGILMWASVKLLLSEN